MRQAAFALTFFVIFLSCRSLYALDITGRTCGDEITFRTELCAPGLANVVKAPFDIYARATTISVNAPSELKLPSAFLAYVFDFKKFAKSQPVSGSLTPPVFYVPKPLQGRPDSLGSIHFRLYNELPPVANNTFMLNDSIPAGDQPINIHTHGLLVRPTDAHGHGEYGDFVGVLGCSKKVDAHCPADPMAMHATEICGFAKQVASGGTCPGMMHAHHEGNAWIFHGHEVILGPVSYKIPIPGNHPAGLNWFHPHAHEISSPQVGAGLAGVLTIGTLCSELTLAPETRQKICTTDADKNAILKSDGIKERFLMLKDLQVFSDRQGNWENNLALKALPISGAAAGAPIPSAEGYRIVPTCEQGDGTAAAILDQGFCFFKADDTSNLDGTWMFTVNGQIQPKISMAQGVPELWRIANLSSNATYRLSLCLDDPKPDTNPQLALCQAKSFGVISLDGGLNPKSKNLTEETEILLPPGARAEIIVAPKQGETLKLVQKGFAQPDLYPAVVLATATTTVNANTTTAVNFMANESHAEAFGRPASFPEPDDCKHPSASLGPNDWLSLPTKNEIVSVFFGRVSTTPEVLTLGLMRGNPEQSKDPTIRAHMLACLAGGNANSYDCQIFKGGTFIMDSRNLCLKHGTKVTFRLYNLTTEMHNFHIHQQKFEVALDFGGIPRQSSGHAHAKRGASVSAVLGSMLQRAAVGKKSTHKSSHQAAATNETASASAAADSSNTALASSRSVDSIPVPPVWTPPASPGDPPGNNPVPEVTMQFDRPEQVGDFVFHCHILEHEDKGMMKRITVYTE